MLTTAGTFRRILIVIAAWVVSFTFCRGGEPTEVATLRLHRVRAADAQRVAALVAEKVAAERVLLIPATRQLAVLAVPSKQTAVAEQIAVHEKEAILFERIVLIKELDLVLIRASGQSLGNGMRQLPVPSGDVKIKSGRASDR